jgi:hypothetical protein
MMSPSALVPIALGEGKREELRMQDEMDALGRQERQKKDKKSLTEQSPANDWGLHTVS